ncbi:hypothetical protein WJX72_003301 [[Myrmecia] bisecta]|uniref:Transcription factor CBF/NF-Y/archaeal histone domain-containing protein n=1 Tax=[Myrmecia] bisecta TaxID=41462 RepID=A0AAW1R647_9CHLO
MLVTSREVRQRLDRKPPDHRDALDDLMERLAKECKLLVQSNEKATLTARDVEAAVRLLSGSHQAAHVHANPLGSPSCSNNRLLPKPASP